MSTEHILLVQWNRIATGREAASIELFGQFINFLGNMQNDRVIDSFEPVLVDPHGGNVNGFILVRGEPRKLDDIRHTDAWRRFMTEATYNLTGFGVTSGVIGKELQERMKRFHKLATK